MFMNLSRSILGKRKQIGHRIWVYLYIQDHKDWTPENIARDLGMSIAQVKQQVRELASSGHIEWNRKLYKHARRSKVPKRLRWEVWERDDFTCQVCGVRRDLTVDHITPVSKGGQDTSCNLQTLCRNCNSRKGEK